MSTRAGHVQREAALWRPLQLFCLYRIVIAGLFTALTLSDIGLRILGRSHPTLFLVVILAYLGFGLLASTTSRLKRPDYTLQIYVSTAIDIATIGLLTYASGGVSSGLGMLLIASMGGIGLLVPRRVAVFFAAIGSLTLLGEEIYGQFTGSITTTAYTQTGIIGALTFAAAFLASTFARRTRESEALATQRGQDLANLAQLNQNIIERMQAGVLVVKDDGTIRLMNDAAWQLLSEPIGATNRIQDLNPNLYQLFIDWLTTQKSGTRTFKPRDSEDRELQARFTRLELGEELATLISLSDLVEVRQQMQAMKLASLGRLTASIAHEIRNPLGAISHAAQLLQENPALPSADLRLLKIITDQSKRMNTVVQNVLRLTRREATHPAPIELLPWLENFVAEFLRQAQLDPQSLQIHVAPYNVVVYFDPNQLHQVMWNLCVNACKYGIRADEPVRLQLLGGLGTDTQYPHLDVIDHGPGIPADQAAQLFEPFYTTTTSGTGLGLYISKELCELNGARIEYLPVPTGGSCFRIRFADPRLFQETA
jgi:two-component system sensor histidine kinase PilS (NtrC family)